MSEKQFAKDQKKR